MDSSLSLAEVAVLEARAAWMCAALDLWPADADEDEGWTPSEADRAVAHMVSLCLGPPPSDARRAELGHPPRPLDRVAERMVFEGRLPARALPAILRPRPVRARRAAGTSRAVRRVRRSARAPNRLEDPPPARPRFSRRGRRWVA